MTRKQKQMTYPTQLIFECWRFGSHSRHRSWQSDNLEGASETLVNILNEGEGWIRELLTDIPGGGENLGLAAATKIIADKRK